MKQSELPSFWQHVAAFVICTLVALVVDAAISEGSNFFPTALTYLPFAIIHTIFLAVPTYVALVLLNMVRWWSICFFALLSATAMPIFMFFLPGSDYAELNGVVISRYGELTPAGLDRWFAGFVSLAIAGTISGILFWVLLISFRKRANKVKLNSTEPDNQKLQT